MKPTKTSATPQNVIPPDRQHLISALRQIADRLEVMDTWPRSAVINTETYTAVMALELAPTRAMHAVPQRAH